MRNLPTMDLIIERDGLCLIPPRPLRLEGKTKGFLKEII